MGNDWRMFKGIDVKTRSSLLEQHCCTGAGRGTGRSWKSSQTSSKAAGACRVFSREITLPSQWCGPHGLPGSALLSSSCLCLVGVDCGIKIPRTLTLQVRLLSSHEPEIFSLCPQSFFFLSFFFIWLRWVLVAARGIFSCSLRTLSCGMWDLDPWPGMEPRTLHREWGVLATGPPGRSLRPHSRHRELPSEPQASLHCLRVTAGYFSFLWPHIWESEPLRFSAASHFNPTGLPVIPCMYQVLPTDLLLRPGIFFPSSAYGWHPFIYQIQAQICQFWRVFPY